MVSSGCRSELVDTSAKGPVVSKRENLQAQVPSDHAARVRGTVSGMQRLFGGRYTLTQFILDATQAHCRRLEEQYHDGEPWSPLTKGVLMRGARLGSPGAVPEASDE